jgi:hypothetical protein
MLNAPSAAPTQEQHTLCMTCQLSPTCPIHSQQAEAFPRADSKPHPPHCPHQLTTAAAVTIIPSACNVPSACCPFRCPSCASVVRGPDCTACTSLLLLLA